MRLWIFECKEPNHKAFKLGLTSAGLLGLAHIIANLLAGCDCICSQDIVFVLKTSFLKLLLTSNSLWHASFSPGNYVSFSLKTD